MTGASATTPLPWIGFSSLRLLHKVGPESLKRLKILARGQRIIDILFVKPTGVRHRTLISGIADAPPQTPVTFFATVQHHAPSYGRQRGPYRITLRDDTEAVFQVLLFRGTGDWITRQYPVNKKILLSGIRTGDEAPYEMAHPDYAGPVQALPLWIGPEILYPLTEGIPLNRLKTWIKEGLKHLHNAGNPTAVDWLGTAADSLPSFLQAINHIHGTDESQWPAAHHRLSLDELFVQQLVLQRSRQQFQENQGIALEPALEKRQTFMNSCPFDFTGAQQRVLAEIDHDMNRTTPMIRLLQGDVGSGKTVVGFCALLNGIAAGYQGAFLAPTEILARQHFDSLAETCVGLQIQCALLTGSLKASEKIRIKEQLAAGDIQLIIGTHALVEESTHFKNLAVVVVDEQHRFGVDQRLKLSNKGRAPHILAMSATPIPRSLALTLHGDLDLSMIDEKPIGRLPIVTTLLSLDRIGDLIQRLEKALDKGAQAYWVCPLIEASETLDYSAAEERFAYLSKKLSHKVALIHGRLKPEEKQQIMADFHEGLIKLLVTTTVIEVGVNVPNARIMIIDHGERFGLSQLHQLRGRVGRSSAASACVITYGGKISATARTRLQAMVDTNDGFKLAAIDLKLRGAGDALGRQQSGQLRYYFADPVTQQALLTLAHQTACTLLRQDPHLLSPQGQAARLALQIFGKETGHERHISG